METTKVQEQPVLPELQDQLSAVFSQVPLLPAAPALLELPMLGNPKAAACQASIDAGPEQPTTVEALLQQLDVQPRDAGPTQPLGDCAAFVDEHLMPKAEDNLGHDASPDQHSSGVYESAIEGTAVISWPTKQLMAPMLTMPMYPPQSPAGTAACAVIEEMLSTCRPAVQPQLSIPIASATSSNDFLAQDMLLEDSCTMLPLVLMDPLQVPDSISQGGFVSVQQMLSELKSKPARSLTHLEVFLDWTLSDSSCAGAMQHCVMAAKKWIVDQLSPSPHQVGILCMYEWSSLQACSSQQHVCCTCENKVKIALF